MNNLQRADLLTWYVRPSVRTSNDGLGTGPAPVLEMKLVHLIDGCTQTA
jgi:hypothetical protein